MDENSFPQQGRTIFALAQKEATRRGSSIVEAEHVVLALLLNTASATFAALKPAGLDHDRFDSALDAERSHSLAIAGITTLVDTRPATPRKGRSAVGASIREAITLVRRRGPQDRRARSLEIALLCGILTPELGTIPRVLAIAGIDRRALLSTFAATKGAE